MISNLGGIVDEGVQAAWETEIGMRVAELEMGEAKTTSWEEVRRRNLGKWPMPTKSWESHHEAIAEYCAAFEVGSGAVGVPRG